MKDLSISILYSEFIKKHWDYNTNAQSPDKVSKTSLEKFNWICANGHHYLESPLQQFRYSKRVEQCPYCRKRNRILLEGFNDLETRFPKIAVEWDTRGNAISAREVLPSSHKKYKWICPLGHHYIMDVSSRTRKKPQGCAVCGGKQVQEGVNDLFSYCINHDNRKKLIDEWDNNVSMKSISANTHAKFNWRCSHGHTWVASPHNRISRGSDCPDCMRGTQVSHLEDYFFNNLNKLLSNMKITDSISKNNREIIHNPETGAPWELDVFIPSLDIAFEFNGCFYHNKQKWLLDIENNTISSREALKSKLCREKGISLLHIWDDDWKKSRSACMSQVKLFIEEHRK